MQNLPVYIKEYKARFIEELIELLKIPSISYDSAFFKEVEKYRHRSGPEQIRAQNPGAK